jgi:hypothetical protein
MDIMKDILHGTSLESLLASLPKVAYEKKIKITKFIFNLFLVWEKVQVYLFLTSLVSPNMLPNVLPPSLGF